MRPQTKKLQNYQETQTPKLENLKSAYKRLSLDLILCAQHIPGEDPNADKEMAEREDRLLFAQEDILQSLADYEISSDEEAADFANLWVELQKAEDADLPSNHLISVFNNLLSFNSQDK